MSLLAGKELHELIDYDKESGIFTWKPRDRSWFSSDRSFNSFNSQKAGREAGNVYSLPRGYSVRRICINGKLYLAHRLAWAMVHGEMPSGEIDHKNGNPLDNRICNLIDSSPKENSKNKKIYSANSSGVSGVSWHKKNSKWVAYANCGGERKYLGLFQKDDLDLAAMAVMEARKEMGFSETHGIRS